SESPAASSVATTSGRSVESAATAAAAWGNGDDTRTAALERERQGVARIVVVLDQQHREPAERLDAVGREVAGVPRARIRGGERQRHREDGAEAGAIALQVDGATVALGQAFDDHKPEAEPAVAAGPPRVRLAEAVEDE